MDTTLEGYPIRDEDGTIIGHHHPDGNETYFAYEQGESKMPELYRVYNDPTPKRTRWGTFPHHFYVYHAFPCPRCHSYTESYSDCPGYGKPLHVCYAPYDDETITGKYVQAMACGNCQLLVCINPKCDWEWRTHGSRRNKDVEVPAWADLATIHFSDTD